jgi:hypothetical protein
MYEKAAAKAGAEAAGEQEHAVVEPALDPCLVGFHQPAGAVLPVGEPEQHDVHEID